MRRIELDSELFPGSNESVDGLACIATISVFGVHVAADDNMFAFVARSARIDCWSGESDALRVAHNSPDNGLSKRGDFSLRSPIFGCQPAISELRERGWRERRRVRRGRLPRTRGQRENDRCCKRENGTGAGHRSMLAPDLRLRPRLAISN